MVPNGFLIYRNCWNKYFWSLGFLAWQFEIVPSFFSCIYGGKSDPGVTVFSHQIPHVLEVGVSPTCSSLSLTSALFEWTSQKLVQRVPQNSCLLLALGCFWQFSRSALNSWLFKLTGFVSFINKRLTPVLIFVAALLLRVRR